MISSIFRHTKKIGNKKRNLSVIRTCLVWTINFEKSSQWELNTMEYFVVLPCTTQLLLILNIDVRNIYFQPMQHFNISHRMANNISICIEFGHIRLIYYQGYLYLLSRFGLSLFCSLRSAFRSALSFMSASCLFSSFFIDLILKIIKYITHKWNYVFYYKLDN